MLVSVNSNSRYKSGGINFVDGQLYWAARTRTETSCPTMPHDRGIFRCDPAISPIPKSTYMLFNPEYESANMIIEDGVILSAHIMHRRRPITPDSLSRRTWARPGPNTTSNNSAVARRSGSTRRTAAGGFESICEQDGSGAARSFSLNRSSHSEMVVKQAKLSS